MVPFYEAEVLFRIMDKREERVKMAHTFYLEYLKLMKHYELLEKLQVKAWKEMYNKFFQPKHADEEEAEEKDPAMKHPMVMLAQQMEDRDAKIATFKLKK